MCRPISIEEFRIYSNQPIGETVELRAYRRNHTGIIQLTPNFTFNGETYGSLSKLEVLKVADKNN